MWHSGQANRTLIVSLRIKCGDAAKPTEVGAIVTAIVMVDVLEHTTVTGAVVVVSITGDIMRNILQRRNIYINFLWLKRGMPVEE